MTNPTHDIKIENPKSLVHVARQLLNLKGDTDYEGTRESIIANVDFKSSNAWTLVFAIFIASVGLNTNSAAVIIGAMLISPLMGPIVGSGLALGTHDLELLRRCFRNLMIAVFISVFTSTIYFLLSPISEAQSELLARTRPSFFDVLIAFFGGAAGIVAISRKEKSTAIPGVAIATALMPPLCTAGYSLATANFSYFVGAIYLFIINSVFITISTLIFVKFLKFKKSISMTIEQQERINKIIIGIAVAVILPSLFMAWYFHREAKFFSMTKSYVQNEIKKNGMFVIDQEARFSLKKPAFTVTVMTETAHNMQIDDIREKAALYLLDPASVEIKLASMTKGLQEKLDSATDQSERIVAELRFKSSSLERRLESINEIHDLEKEVFKELSIFLPKLKELHFKLDDTILDSKSISPENIRPQVREIILVWQKRPIKQELVRSQSFLKNRVEETAALKNVILDRI